MIGRRGVGINSSYILQQKDQYSQLERQMWLQFITINLKMCIPANANNLALKFMSKPLDINELIVFVLTFVKLPGMSKLVFHTEK